MILWGVGATLRPTTSDWAPTLWRRVKDKNVSFRGIRGPS
jgi:hypothetical protein